jgi:hypothetical protein
MQYRVYARIVLLLVGLSGPLPFTALQAGDELALNLKRLSDRVLIAWVGNHMQTIDVVGLRTARGLVVIETNLIPPMSGSGRRSKRNSAEAISNT